MATNLATVHTFQDGDPLTAAQLNAMDENIRANHQLLISPMDGNLDGGGFSYTNTGSVVFADTLTNPNSVGKVQRNGTLLKFHDGSAIRVNQVLQYAGQSGVLSNTAVEAALYTYTVLANTLGVLGQLEVTIMPRIGLLHGSNVQIKAYYGGVFGPSITLENTTGSTISARLCPVTLTLGSNNSTSAQVMVLEARVTHIQNNLVDGFMSSPNVASYATFAIDSTAAQALQVNVVFSAADPANSIDYLMLKNVMTS